MNFLFENPIPIFAVGAVLVTLCGLVFLSRRNLTSLVALVTVVLFVLAMVGMERMVVTEREQVELAVAELMRAIENNDLAAVRRRLAPTARIATDAQSMMPQVRVEDTGYTSLEVTLTSDTEPLAATSSFRGKVDGVHKTSGHRLFYFDTVQLDWTKQDGRWVVEGYRVFYQGQAIDPVGSMRGNLVAPAK